MSNVLKLPSFERLFEILFCSNFLCRYETKTPLENARRYFDKYGKCKRTKEALTELIVQVKERNRKFFRFNLKIAMS